MGGVNGRRIIVAFQTVSGDLTLDDVTIVIAGDDRHVCCIVGQFDYFRVPENKMDDSSNFYLCRNGECVYQPVTNRYNEGMRT